jgi:cell division protein FtsB
VDAGILLVLGGVAGFYEAWSQLKTIKSLEQQLKVLEDRQTELQKDNQDLKTYVSSLKLGQTMRMGNNAR